MLIILLELLTPMPFINDPNCNNEDKVHFDVPEKEPYEGKATQKQKQFLWELGVRDQEKIDSLGKKQASLAINQLLALHRGRKNGSKSKTLFVSALILFALSIPACVFSPQPDVYGHGGGLGVFGFLLFFSSMVCIVLGVTFSIRTKK